MVFVTLRGEGKLLSSEFGVKIMSVHQSNDGNWIVVFKSIDGKRKERSFGRGPDAESSARAYDEAMLSRGIAPVAPLWAEQNIRGDFLRRKHVRLRA